MVPIQAGNRPSGAVVLRMLQVVETAGQEEKDESNGERTKTYPKDDEADQDRDCKKEFIMIFNIDFNIHLLAELWETCVLLIALVLQMIGGMCQCTYDTYVNF